MAPSSRETVALYTIEVDGTEIDPAHADSVQEITVTDHLRLPDVCTLTIGYPAGVEGNPFGPLDESPFEVGAALVIRLGSTTELHTQVLFRGEILTTEPSFGAGGVALEVRAYDRSHRMLRTRKQRAFANQTIADIVSSVCRDYGLSADVEGGGEPLEYVLQHNETDWDFVWRLARRIGFEFLIEDRTAVFRRAGQHSEVVELRYPEDLLSFRPTITAIQQVDEVNLRAYDHGAKRQIHVTCSEPNQVTEAGVRRQDVVGRFEPTKLEVAGQSARSDGEAEDMAQGLLDELANAYLAADGASLGDPRIKAGVMLDVSGVGRRYSGSYRVTCAVHTLRGGGTYMTEFSNSAGERTLLAQLGGGRAERRSDSLVVGVVTSNDDPDSLGRVKVSFPALSNQESTWAPVAVPASGKGRGASMLPVADEQVIVGFENGDPSYPYVLGSVFNGSDTPGEELAVKDGSFAVLSDKQVLVAAKEDIALRSDGGKWKIDIKGGAIEENVKSGQGGQGGYKGAFDGDWKLKATRSVVLESDMEVTVKAPKVSIESTGPLQLKGNPVKIDSSAMVSISGSIIKLG